MSGEVVAAQLIPDAIDRFGALVQAVPAVRWGSRTPCTAWTARDLVNHVVGEHLWAPHILAGQTLAEVGGRYDGDVVGADPAAAWQRAAKLSRIAWKSAEPTAQVHLSYGDAPLSDYAGQMLVDLTVHGWDLARGTGQDDALDPVAVEVCLTYARATADFFAGIGIIDPPVSTTSADPAVQLISLLGRKV